MNNQKPAKNKTEFPVGYSERPWIEEAEPIPKNVFDKIQDRLTGKPSQARPRAVCFADVMPMHKKRVESILTQLAEPDYLSLAKVLKEAYDQASAGKGHERHAYGEPFEEQDIVTEAVTLGLAAPAFQARKKIKEALRLFDRHGADRAIPDLLGAINYAAAIIIAMRIKAKPEIKTEEYGHGFKACGGDHAADAFTYATATADKSNPSNDRSTYLLPIEEYGTEPSFEQPHIDEDGVAWHPVTRMGGYAGHVRENVLRAAARDKMPEEPEACDRGGE